MTHWGLDRARRGWAVVGLDRRRASVAVVASASEVEAREDEVVAVDIPLALPDGIGRRADRQARAALGPRAATVFPALPRWCYERPYDEDARAEARRRYGKAYSKQAWNLGPAVLDAQGAAGPGWVESHPELAFLVRNHRHPLPPKRSWDGVRERLEILDRCGVAVPTVGFRLGVRPDDVLDAAICAVVAREVAAGTARRLPAEPDPGEAVIWY